MVFLSGASVFAAILFGTATAAAQVILQTVNELNSGGSNPANWTNAIWGGGPAAATVGNDYLTAMISGTNAAVRTINTSTLVQSFTGDHLIISNGCALYLKHAGTNCTVNLILDGGQVIEHGGGSASAPVMLGGTLQVNSNTNTLGVSGSYSGTDYFNLGSDQSGGNHNIWLQANVSGSGNIIVNMLAVTPNTLSLFGTNSAFTGSWTNNDGTIEIESGSVNALGSGPVIMTLAGTTFLNFNSTNNLVITNSILGNGTVIKLNTDTVTLSAPNTYTGATIISNGVLQIGAGFSITNSSPLSLEGGTLDASLIGGLVLTNSQQMNCNGTLISNLTASTGNTLNFNMSAASNDILNITGSLTLIGNPGLQIIPMGFIPSGTYRLINYSGTIQGGGSFSLITNGVTETFQLNTSTPGQINVNVTGSQRHLIWQGNSSSTWDTTTANWTGDSTVYGVGDNVTFNDSANPGSTFVQISSSTLYPGSMTISNSGLYYTFYGASSVGIITSGTLTKLGTNEVDFATSGNQFSGPIDIEGGILSVGAGSDFGSLVPNTVTNNWITNNGVLQVNMDTNAVAFNMPISGSGSLVITNGGSGGVTVSIGGMGHNTYTGLTTIGDGCQLNIATSNALGSTSSGTIVLPNGRLGVVSYVGSMTVLEPLTISGTGIGSAPGALYVNNGGNNNGNVVTWAGPVTIAGNTQVRAVNANTRMNLSNTVLGTNVALECTAGDAASLSTDGSAIIDFQNAVSLGSSGSLVADGVGTVYLDDGTNAWGGGTTVAGGTLRVNGVLNGGTVTVNNNPTNTATLAGSGTILGSVTVQANAILSPGSYSAIGTLTVSNSVTLQGTTVMRLDRNNAQNADKLAANSVAFGGTLTVTNNGAAVQGGDTFQLFSGSVSGAFTITNLPPLSAPLTWTNVSAGTIMVLNTNPAPVPWTNSFVVRNGTNLIFQINPTTSGASYTLQSTPSLKPPIVWTTVQQVTAGAPALIFTNPILPGSSNMFYRTKNP
jgi:fibronectin-binding autotransporter adhesin